MPYSIKVVIIDGDTERRKTITDILSAVNDIIIAGETEAADKGIQMIGECSPEVTIVGGQIKGSDGFRFCESVNAIYPYHPVVMVTSDSGEDIYRKAMRSGVKEVLHPPFNLISLTDAIYRVFDIGEKHRTTLEYAKMEPKVREKTAKIYSVFSTKGGVGKTTVSTNLAVLLKQTGKKVALLDLDVYSGDVALALDIAPKRNVSDLVSDIGKLDLDLLESYMFKHSSGVMVLPAPTKIEYADFVAPDHINKILRILVKEYDYIVVDCASYMHDPVLVALDASDVILLVTTMDIFAIKNLRSCISALESSNYSRTKFRLVVNRALSEAGISEKDIEKTLGLPITVVLPQEDGTILKSINQGMPVVLSARKSGFTKGLQELVRKITGSQVNVNPVQTVQQNRGTPVPSNV